MSLNSHLASFAQGPLSIEELRALWMFYTSAQPSSAERVLKEADLLKLLSAIAEQDTPNGAFFERPTEDYARYIMINIMQGKAILFNMLHSSI